MPPPVQRLMDNGHLLQAAVLYWGVSSMGWRDS
jgi:hypothetical protein